MHPHPCCKVTENLSGVSRVSNLAYRRRCLVTSVLEMVFLLERLSRAC